MAEQRLTLTGSLSDGTMTVGLVLLLVLTLMRGRTLLGRAPTLDSHGEASLGWAYRSPAVSRILRDAEPSLKFGEMLWITVPTPDPRYDPGWLTVMANYSWPHQSVLGVSVSARPHRRNGSVTIIDIADKETARILRATPSRNAPP